MRTISASPNANRNATPDNAPNPLAGAAQAAAFLQSYWQIRPAVIRQAMASPEARGVINATQLRRLIARDDVESRLIERRTATRGAARAREVWTVCDGPFNRAELPDQRDTHWTVLVQGVDSHHDAGRALLDKFRFIPDARLDDLMISLAGDMGGVGPHIDSYDVFLLQLAGKRRWSMSPPAGAAAQAVQHNQPLKLLKRFKPTHVVELSAGDMLYLPPGWAHDGVAQRPCLTASIGFRSPTAAQWQAAWLADAADRILEAHDADQVSEICASAATVPAKMRRDLETNPARRTTQITRWRRHPAQIDPRIMQRATQVLEQWHCGPKAMREFIGRYLSEPKPGIWFDRSDGRGGAAYAAARKHGVVLDRRTRMLWHGDKVFINGESVTAEFPSRTLLRRLADQRSLSRAETTTLLKDHAARAWLVQWLDAGWVIAPVGGYKR